MRRFLMSTSLFLLTIPAGAVAGTFDHFGPEMEPPVEFLETANRGPIKPNEAHVTIPIPVGERNCIDPKGGSACTEDMGDNVVDVMRVSNDKDTNEFMIYERREKLGGDGKDILKNAYSHMFKDVSFDKAFCSTSSNAENLASPYCKIKDNKGHTIFLMEAHLTTQVGIHNYGYLTGRLSNDHLDTVIKDTKFDGGGYFSDANLFHKDEDNTIRTYDRVGGVFRFAYAAIMSYNPANPRNYIDTFKTTDLYASALHLNSEYMFNTVKDIAGINKDEALQETDYNIDTYKNDVLPNDSQKIQFMYIFGHGDKIKGKGNQSGDAVLLPPLIDNKEYNENKGIKLSEIREAALKSNKDVFIILDSCNSGLIGKDEERQLRDDPSRKRVDALKRVDAFLTALKTSVDKAKNTPGSPPQVHILTASAGDQAVWTDFLGSRMSPLSWLLERKKSDKTMDDIEKEIVTTCKNPDCINQSKKVLDGVSYFIISPHQQASTTSTPQPSDSGTSSQ